MIYFRTNLKEIPQACSWWVKEKIDKHGAKCCDYFEYCPYYSACNAIGIEVTNEARPKCCPLIETLVETKEKGE